mgnify:FL=1
MADHKEINLPQSASYSNLPEYKDHVNQILTSYDSPEGVLGELVRQMADAMWWVKTYQKDKDHLIVMKMANCLVDRNDYRIDPSESALQIFESVFKTWGGESISADEQGALDSVMASKGHSLTSMRAEAVRKSVKELEVIDR